jgi:hypothetical protein
MVQSREYLLSEACVDAALTALHKEELLRLALLSSTFRFCDLRSQPTTAKTSWYGMIRNSSESINSSLKYLLLTKGSTISTSARSFSVTSGRAISWTNLTTVSSSSAEGLGEYGSTSFRADRISGQELIMLFLRYLLYHWQEASKDVGRLSDLLLMSNVIKLSKILISSFAGIRCQSHDDGDRTI